MKNLRTWIEIDQKALEHNLKEFRKLVPPKIKLMAVIKSNAYGHGLVLVAKFSAKDPELWFGVDSVVEALRLRNEGIDNPVLVLGSTLKERMEEAAEKNVILAVSNFEGLRALAELKQKAQFHLKIDTGMHRHGFLPEQIPGLIKFIKRNKLSPSGIFTHFASAKDISYPTYTFEQLRVFHKVSKQFEASGFKNLIRHAAASGGAILFRQSRLDMVRIGMGIYGYYPSLETKIQRSEAVRLKPVLSWKTRISEVKIIPKGSYVGYDLTERVERKTKIAVIPVGYWHGYDRGLSSAGQMLVRGKRAKILGRVSMDIIVIDITDIPGAKVGDEVVLIGRQGREELWADEISLKIGTTQYEFLTRINPLIKRILV